MPTTLTMPKLSPTMTEGTIIRWHKKEGDHVKEGDLLIEVATDKATVEYAALDEGYIRSILVKEGEEGKVNDPIAILTASATESLEGYVVAKPKEAEAPLEKPTEKAQAGAPQPVARLTAPGFAPAPPLENYTFEFAPQDQILASPYAKKLAKEQGFDLSTVTGTGPGGRVVAKDLDLAQKKTVATFGSHEKPKDPPGSYDVEKLTPMRKAISERLQASKSFVPHFYIEQVITVDSMVRLREELKASNIKVTFNDFIMRAVALALKEHPEVNSGFDSVNNQIIRFKTIDIAVAVSIPDGLITPIVRHADYKNLGQLSVEVKHLAQLAKEGKLKSEQYQGGSFTISNLGMFGVTGFTAVINPPQAAILAIGGMQEVAVFREGACVPSQQMKVTLSADHRVIDGADGARFIQTVKRLLENPATLLL